MTRTEFDQFFEPYARNVAGFYEASYWRLADELIKALVRRHLGMLPGGRLLDAGGGTGRWAVWYSSALDVDVTIADKSPQMLEEARRTMEAAAPIRVPRMVECDLCDAPSLGDAEFDGIVSTYGVLSFLEDPAAAFRTFYRVLKPGGRALLMSHSLSNALHSKVNRDGADAAELADILATGTVRWAPHVPRLRVYSVENLRDLAAAAGFRVCGAFGVTSVVHPGPEDFGYPYDTISAISRRLEDPAYFAQALELELAASEQSGWAERGVNLMIYIERPAEA
ncbi:SAM-dependent methyltransferase [Catellatospora sp. TT07R-123]|uniref:class I SAM-dependent methyltransferase n=1 Tax=Catellatospora sp. TT07R-123 TaxID=2733863 RepID=UPI001AFF6617|nr:methyltransferase domain-containing protein [Catellatospora sp. TT07R-123]GHJ45902.1 SAM-dependent methyltransferase [Catellatospora sp. TT07R-123]